MCIIVILIVVFSQFHECYFFFLWDLNIFLVAHQFLVWQEIHCGTGDYRLKNYFVQKAEVPGLHLGHMVASWNKSLTSQMQIKCFILWTTSQVPGCWSYWLFLFCFEFSQEIFQKYVEERRTNPSNETKCCHLLSTIRQRGKKTNSN